MKIITSLDNPLLKQFTTEIHRENAIAAMDSYMKASPVEMDYKLPFLEAYLSLYTNSLEVSHE